MTSQNLTQTDQQTIGQLANTHAAAAVFQDYRERKASNTIARQDQEMNLFAQYLAVIHIDTNSKALTNNPEAWQGITWGIVAGFVRWQLQQGFAVASVNLHLSTVRAYAKLAFQAGTLDASEWQQIHAINGYSHKEYARIDEARTTTRRSTRKVEAVTLTDEQVKTLKADHPNTPQGRRDRLLMCLLLNLGLRVGEVTLLRPADFDLKGGMLHFYRPKVDKVQTHNLINGTWDAARDYITQDTTEPDAPLLKASRKGGTLTHAGMTRFGVAKRVQEMGQVIGIENLSPHDCRHSWATRAAKNKTDAFSLRDAGGWSSMAMPGRYVEAAKIANEGVKLSE